MKMVIAYLQPFMTSRVVQALHRIRGITGATFVSERGFGRGRRGAVPTEEMVVGTGDKVRVEVMIADQLEAAVVNAIRDTAHTGNRGDGKVFVVPLERAVRIETGQEGEAVVLEQTTEVYGDAER